MLTGSLGEIRTDLISAKKSPPQSVEKNRNRKLPALPSIPLNVSYAQEHKWEKVKLPAFERPTCLL